MIFVGQQTDSQPATRLNQLPRGFGPTVYTVKRFILTTTTCFLLHSEFQVTIASGQSMPTYYWAGDWDPYAAQSTTTMPNSLFGVPDAPRRPNEGLGEPDGPDEFGGPGGPGDGSGGPGGLGGPGGEPGYGITWYPSVAVSGQGTQLGIVRNRLGIDVPVWFQGASAVMMSLNVDESHFSGEAILPDTLRAFPSDLWNVQVGLKHMRQLSNGWTSMLMFDIGSASDKPFHSMRDVNFQLGGFLIIPAKNDRDSWMLGVLYSPLGSPSFPIPLLSYSWKPSETFQMNIGLPCSMKWQATERLSFDLSYFPILSIDALATYKLSEHLHAYGGYQNVSDSWFLTDRVHKDDQFFANERRLIVGIRRDLSEKMKLDFSAGYAFDRHFGVGDFQTSLTDRVNLESGAFLAGRLTWDF